MINTIEKAKQEREEVHWGEGRLRFDGVAWKASRRRNLNKDLKAVRGQVTKPVSAT